jgi:hypothetical protein
MLSEQLDGVMTMMVIFIGTFKINGPKIGEKMDTPELKLES